jgi:hypothetical protein
VANNIFYLKENRRKLPGHKIASSAHKIASSPLSAQNRLRRLEVKARPHILCTAGAILRVSDFRHGQTKTPKKFAHDHFLLFFSILSEKVLLIMQSTYYIVVCHFVANNIFYLKENRRKLLGHKIASSTHKIAPSAHKIASSPLSAQNRLRRLEVRSVAYFMHRRCNFTR